MWESEKERGNKMQKEKQMQEARGKEQQSVRKQLYNERSKAKN